MAVLGSDALVLNDGADAAADVGELGSEVRDVDAVREGAGEVWDYDFGKFRADTCDGYEDMVVYGGIVWALRVPFR